MMTITTTTTTTSLTMRIRRRLPILRSADSTCRRRRRCWSSSAAASGLGVPHRSVQAAARLRRRICATARHLTGNAGERSLTLEYLDEAAGLAILVADEELDSLSMSTLKATLASKAAADEAAAADGWRRDCASSSRTSRAAATREGLEATATRVPSAVDLDGEEEPRSTCAVQ